MKLTTSLGTLLSTTLQLNDRSIGVSAQVEERSRAETRREALADGLAEQISTCRWMPVRRKDAEQNLTVLRITRPVLPPSTGLMRLPADKRKNPSSSGQLERFQKP